MLIQITITCETVEELRKSLLEALGVYAERPSHAPVVTPTECGNVPTVNALDDHWRRVEEARKLLAEEDEMDEAFEHALEREDRHDAMDEAKAKPKRTRRAKVELPPEPEPEKVAPPAPIKPTQADAIVAAKAFIAGHRDGKDRGNAIIKGICATLGFEKVSLVPEDRVPELLELMKDAA